ncbi:MAG: hypothetical protein Q4D93_03280 [Porphyromonas sp.]|nr:hypothetical protein [Porphyromonas sp.]
MRLLRRWSGLGLALVLLCSLLGACDGRQHPEEQHVVPYAPVHLILNLYGAEHHLVEPFSLIAITAPRIADEYVGCAGVVVVHGFAASGGELPYFAYDLICPYDLPSVVATVPREGKGDELLTTKCPKCGSVYDLAMGTGHPTSGPSRYPLQRYRVGSQGEQYIVITH